MNRDDLEQMLRAAYEQGAHDVHENWQEDRDPDFAEVASDYVASLDLAALRTPGGDEVERAREYVASSMHDRDKSWGDLVRAGERDDCPEMHMVLKAMRAERLSASRPVREGWRPIESAPRDGTKFDLWTTK